VRHLFISGSEKPRTLRDLLLTVFVVALTLGIGDPLINLLIRKASRQTPSIISGAQNVAGVEALWGLQESGIVPVVFTGSSQMQTDASPYVFDDAIRLLTGQATTSVNVSFTGAGPQISYQVIRNLFVPAGVKTVIYGIEMRALHKQSGNFIEGFRSAPLGYALFLPAGFEQSAAIWLTRHSTLVRYRSRLRLLLGGGQADEQIAPSDDRGYLPLPGTPPRNGGIVLGQFVPFETSDAVRNAIRDLARCCREFGIRCIVANLPLHELAYALIPPKDERQYRDELRRLLAEGNLPLWDFDTAACRAYLGDASYYDLNHLNSAGAPKFTRLLAGVYVQQVFGQPLAPDSAAACAQVIAPS
jgi:hypothetical protein